MLEHIFIEINALKTCLHCFLVADASFNKANKAVSNLLFTDSFFTSHLPFLMTIFLKCRSLFPLLFLSLFLAVSAEDRSWLTLGIILENLIKRSGKWKSQKIVIFDLLESFFHRAIGFLFVYVNIYHRVFRISIPFVWCSL